MLLIAVVAVVVGCATKVAKCLTMTQPIGLRLIRMGGRVGQTGGGGEAGVLVLIRLVLKRSGRGGGDDDTALLGGVILRVHGHFGQCCGGCM